MWLYEKKLEYPVKIKNPNPALAKFIISQVGGPDGELAAATRYLQQRYSMPYAQVKGILTDIGTEELAHIEMVSAIIHQLTRCLTPEQIKRSGFDTYFVDHGTGVYPQAAAGVPFPSLYCRSQATHTPISMRILQQNRKPAKRMTISCALRMTPMYAIQSNSCVSVKSYTSSVSATRCASPRKIRMQRTSMRSTLALIKPAIRPISCSRRRVLRLERLGLLSARLNRPVRLQPAAAVHQQTPATGAPPPPVDVQTRHRRTPADAPPPPVAVRQ